MADHGTVGRYDDGCRCQPCKDANAARKRRGQKAQYALRDVQDGVIINKRAKHGTLNGYQYYGCRCEECVQAYRDYYGKGNK